MDEGWRPGGEDRRQAGRCPGAPPLAVQAPCCPPSPHSAGAVSGSQLARVRCRPAPPGQLDGLMWTAGARQRISLRLDASIGLTRHGAAAAGLRQAPRRRGISGLEAPIGVGERSGRLRPYVRPVARRLPLAIMGVRVRVRRQSGSRARGTRASTASPELSDHSLPHPAVRRLPPDRAGSRPPPIARVGMSRRGCRSGRDVSRRPVDLLARHQRPSDARHLVCQRHRRQPDGTPRQQPAGPHPGGAVPLDGAATA